MNVLKTYDSANSPRGTYDLIIPVMKSALENNKDSRCKINPYEADEFATSESREKFKRKLRNIKKITL